MVKQRFNDIVLGMQPEIRKIACAGRQRVPGMDPDDIEAELLFCLWKARITYKPGMGVTFPAYWWSVWLNHKNDLTKRMFRQMRDVRKEVVREIKDDEGDLLVEDLIPIAPPFATPQEKAVWTLIASGVSLATVRKQIGARALRKILDAWKNDPYVKGVLA